MTIDIASTIAVSSKLEPFVLMSKSTKGAAAAKLIADATTAPGVFVFGELLEMPNVQELAKTDHASALALLELFAYGTMEDYENSKTRLPQLNEAQLTKLRLLTIVSLALERRILPYADLLRVLRLPTIRAVEDLVIDGIYADLLRGRLDQKLQQFEVEYAAGRDVAPQKLNTILEALQDWARTTAAVLNTLDTQRAALSAHADAQVSAEAAHIQAVSAALAEVREKNFKETRGGRGRGGMGMGMGLGGLGARSGHTADEEIASMMMMDVDSESRRGASFAGEGKGRKMKIAGDNSTLGAAMRKKYKF